MALESAPHRPQHTFSDIHIDTLPVREPDMEVPSKSERAEIFRSELDEGLLRIADSALKRVGVTDGMKTALLETRKNDPSSLVELRYTDPKVTQVGVARSFAMNLWTDLREVPVGADRAVSEASTRELVTPRDFKEGLIHQRYDDKQIQLRMQVYEQKYRRMFAERDTTALSAASIPYMGKLGEVPDPYAIITGKSIQLSLTETGDLSLNRLAKKESPESTSRIPRFDYVWEPVLLVPSGTKKPALASLVQEHMPSSDRGFYRRIGKRIL